VSTLKVEVVRIQSVEKHPNADSLDLITINGWNVVSRKYIYKEGDLAVYIPIDSVLPESIENKLFPEGSKITLQKGRVKSIKIRGAISQGMLAGFDVLGIKERPEGTDLTKELKITKYEPPLPDYQSAITSVKKSKRLDNSNFKKYTDIENIKNYVNLFQENQQVYVSEKLHGTSYRAGWSKKDVSTFWPKVIRFFLKIIGLWKEYEFVYGSRNVQLQHSEGENLYKKICDKYLIKERLTYGEAIYGEVVGPGIQKGYSYGLPIGEHALYLYDVQINGKYLSHKEFKEWCDKRGFERVPEMYVGPYNHKMIMSMRDGDSFIGKQKVREGIVVKPVKEETCITGRKVLKAISDIYLLKDPSDFH